MISLKTEKELVHMRKAGAIVANILDMLRERVRPGITTGELDAAVTELIEREGALAAFKGYKPTHSVVPFPGAICASINEQIVHGIPSMDCVLQEGDILSVDVGVSWNGYFGDAACTYPVGAVSEKRRALLDVTERSLELAIEAAVVGNTVGDIGHAVESYVVPKGYGLVRDYSGHGVGKKLHEAPQIPNYGTPGRGVTLKAGMTLAIEPMVMTGSEDTVLGADQWVVSTADGSDAAHFERSIVITDNGPEILTPWKK